MNRNKLGHLAIAASAGSGKTFQLAHRYIRLLADGVTPDRIVALTFSRKAAGEMFDSVVKHLREAAAQDEAAAEAARRIGLPGVGRERFLGLLRVFTDNLQHVHISTLDSFIVGVARSFPMELGIPLDFVVAEDESPEAGSIREEVFARIFDSRNQSGNEREKLGEAFNQATSRRQEKRFHEVLSELVRSGRRYYRILPMASAWGDERTIWPQGMRWPALPGDPDALADKLVTSLSERTGNEKFIERWRALLGFLCHCARVGYWDNRRKPENALLEHALTEIAKLEAGSCVFRFYGKEYTLTRTECSQLFTLLGGVIGMEIRRRLEETRGTFKLLDLYEQHYQRVARERGSFTFGDVQVLLTGANTFSGGARLSRSPTGENRLYIDYRLNCRLDHWLIDEFQDTSDLQWAVLENLADEILQDTTGERSFFYVGDVKQAIYGWREGNRRLFSAILNRYGKRIETRPLSTSYRSCRAIVDTVNEIFGDISGDLLPEETLEEWAKVWQTHRCEEGRVPDDGVVMALAPLADDAAEAAEEKKEEEPCHRLIAVLLEEIKPLQRGLSAAILVRENKQAEEIVDFLRRRCPGLPVTHEGPAAITDNPVVRALLSLVKLGAHPEDFFAWRHLQMTPLALEFAKQGMTRRDVSLHVLRRIQSGGVRDLITDWGRRLERHQPLDEFGRQRLADLINVAAEFDLSGSRDGDEFLRLVENHEIREETVAGSVRVMTIHQAKGLGFDVVFFPQPFNARARPMGQRDPSKPLVSYDPLTRRPRWILNPPPRALMKADEILATELRREAADLAFDELCVLYVAMTRAKRALYVITDAPRKKKTDAPRKKKEDFLAGFSSSVFLRERFAAAGVGDGRITVGGEECLCLYERGNPKWFWTLAAGSEVRGDPGKGPNLSEFGKRKSHRVRLALVRPSDEEQAVRNAAWCFAEENPKVLAFGSEIHALFRRVEWIETLEVQQVIADWLKECKTNDAEVQRDVCEQFCRAVEVPEVRGALAKPVATAELWREQAFEIILDDRLVSGVFDRVTIQRDNGGTVAFVEVLDYKSDRVEKEEDLPRLVEQYRPQLELYARALCRIFHLPSERVGKTILFTRPARVIKL